MDSGTFAITGEISSPRGTDYNLVIERTKLIADYCDAINVTDNARGIPTMSSTACARIVLAAGGEPVLQLSTRDRNRISIESELYGAYALGIRNLLFITGDPATTVPYSETKIERYAPTRVNIRPIISIHFRYFASLSSLIPRDCLMIRIAITKLMKLITTINDHHVHIKVVSIAMVTSAYFY